MRRTRLLEICGTIFLLPLYHFAFAGGDTIPDPSEKAPVSLSPEEEAWLQEHPAIRVGSDPDWAPLEFMDEEERFHGISIDYLRVVGEILGVRFENVPSRDWKEVLEKGERREVDMFTFLCETPERLRSYIFTKPYNAFPIVIFTGEDVSFIGEIGDLRRKKVAVVEWYAIERWLKADCPEIEVVSAESIREALELLHRGEVFGYAGAILTTGHCIREMGYTHIKVAGETPYDYEQRFAVRNDWPVFAGILQKGLDAIPEETRSAIYHKWVPLRYEHAFDYSLLWKVALGATVVLSLFVYWNRSLSTEVRRRTTQITSANEELRNEIGKKERVLEALQISETRFSEFMEHLPAGAGIKDENGRVLFVNRYMRESLDAEKWIGRKSEENLPADIAQVMEDLDRKALLVGPGAVIQSMEGVDGVLRTYRVIKFPIVHVNQPKLIGAIALDITDIVQAQDALKRSERNYREIFNATNDAIFILDESGAILDVNERAFEMFGYARDELGGLSIGDLSLGEHPFSNDEAPIWIQETLANSPQLVDWCARRKNGDLFWAEVSLRATSIGGEKRVLAVVRDVSDRRQTEQALRDSERRYRSLFEAANDAILLMKEDRYIDCNPKALEMFRCTREQITGAYPSEYSPILQPDGRKSKDKASEKIDAVYHGSPQSFEWQHKTRDGVLFDSSVSLNRMDVGGIPHLLAIVRDLTSRRKAERERATLEDQLRQAQKMEAIGQLAGGVAHDFNNLLLAISGYTEMASEDLPRDSLARSNLGEVLKAADRATSLIRQLLVFSRREALRLENLDLNELVKDLLNMIGRVIGEHIDLQFSPGPAAIDICADAGQVEQVIVNLCVNARDAMPEGGKLVIETSVREFDSECGNLFAEAKEGKYAVLSISDSGSGIPEEIRDKIFEPFFTTKEASKGTGLGLATVYAIARKHDGLVTLDSKEGEGTVFQVHFPVAEETQDARMQSQKGSKPPIHGTGETVLYAEDDLQVREFGIRMLERGGYRVLGACDGEEAIDVFEENIDEIDLALLDVVMPKKTGRMVHDHIRSERPDLPIIFASGYSFDILEEGHLPEKDYVLIHKPFGREELLTQVKQLLATG